VRPVSGSALARVYRWPLAKASPAVDALTSDQVFQLAIVAIGAVAAIAGSLVGALAGALYQGRLARPRLKVEARWAFYVGAQAVPDLVTITSANVGPLPMRVDQCGLRLSVGEQRMALMQDDLGQEKLPADLGPGQSVAMRIFLPRVLGTLQEQADRQKTTIIVIGAYATDATSKEWRGPINMKDLGASPRP
jgi:hypothetical protein